MGQVNRGSFVIVFDGFGPERFPRPFQYDKNYCSPAVVMVPGETYSLYMNANVAGFGSLSNGTNTYPVSSSSSPLAVLAGTHSIVTFSIGSGIPPGNYIMSSGGNQTTSVAVLDAASADKDTALVEFGHNRSLGDFYYPYAPEGYLNRIRIRLNTKGIQPSIEKQVYSQTTDGQYRGLNGRSATFTMFETPEYSDLMHEAALRMTLHDIIKINGIDYTFRPESSYSIQENSAEPVSNGEFGLTRNDTTILIRA